MGRLKSSEQFDAYQRGYSDRENGLPRNCPWYDRPNRDGYRNGYNAAKLAERDAA